jgi:hypothetical protein
MDSISRQFINWVSYEGHCLSRIPEAEMSRNSRGLKTKCPELSSNVISLQMCCRSIIDPIFEPCQQKCRV